MAEPATVSAATTAIISGCFAVGGGLLTALVVWLVERSRRTGQDRHWLLEHRHEAYLELLRSVGELRGLVSRRASNSNELARLMVEPTLSLHRAVSTIHMLSAEETVTLAEQLKETTLDILVKRAAGLEARELLNDVVEQRGREDAFLRGVREELKVDK